jgi:hypothetical protein
MGVCGGGGGGDAVAGCALKGRPGRVGLCFLFCTVGCAMLFLAWMAVFNLSTSFPMPLPPSAHAYAYSRMLSNVRGDMHARTRYSFSYPSRPLPAFREPSLVWAWGYPPEVPVPARHPPQGCRCKS